MVSTKSDKELAFLHDLFVAPDWGERFSELADEHVVLPAKGRALYLVCGTGGHVIAVQERVGDDLRFIGIDENEECLDLARAKAIATKDPIEFRLGRLDDLDLADDHFDFALGDASLLDPPRVAKMLAEMVRVVSPGAAVALSVATASSFGEFFSVYWEALYNCGVPDHECKIKRLISERPTVSEVESLAENQGLEEVASWTRVEEFDYESGEQFLNAPLISDFLMNDWLDSVPENLREPLLQEIARIINEERHDAEFALSVKATLIVGRKAHRN